MAALEKSVRAKESRGEEDRSEGRGQTHLAPDRPARAQAGHRQEVDLHGEEDDSEEDDVHVYGEEVHREDNEVDRGSQEDRGEEDPAKKTTARKRTA